MYAFANVTSISEHPNFNPEKPTVLYCHGYLEAPPNESIHLIVDSYLQRNDHNVVILDWSRLVTGDYLLTAAPNAIAVSNYVRIIVKNFIVKCKIGMWHFEGGAYDSSTARQMVCARLKYQQFPFGWTFSRRPAGRHDWKKCYVINKR